MATYKDIQSDTGLALSTISKYFNGRTVLEENRLRIEESARRLDFRPNGFAQKLRSRRSRTVGVLLPVLDNEFHLTIIAGVEEALRPHGMSVIVAASPSPDDHAVELLMGHMVDGIVAIAPHHDVAALRAARGRVPVVKIDWDDEGLGTDGVFLDNVAAGAMGARHLLDHGHRRIAVLAGDQDVSSMRLRGRGVRDELRADGIELPDQLAPASPLTIEAGAEATRALLRIRPRPTALFCLNYELTVGALVALNESGLRLGRDVSVVGFDGVEVARVTAPPLTIVVQPTRDIALRAADLIARRIDERSRSGSGTADADGVRTELLPPRLVPGGSVLRLDA